jgi:Zn-dependent M28 family amino/carboxypeptidase
VRLGKGSKRLVVGAHYDAFKDSPGANGNGSGVAVLLALIQHMQNVDWNFSVDFCFFDHEESQLMGSMYYIQQFVMLQKHLGMINLDIEGSGDEVYVGPVSRSNDFLMRYVHEAAKKNELSLVEHLDYPVSDHVSFANYSLENVSISVVPKGDGDRLSKYVHNGNKADSLDMPKVLGVLRTVDDRSIFVDPASLKTSYEFTKTLLEMVNDSKR